MACRTAVEVDLLADTDRIDCPGDRIRQLRLLGSRTFNAGDLLALGLLPLRSLRNRGMDELSLLAIRRIEKEG
jgi:hypothetical protein